MMSDEKPTYEELQSRLAEAEEIIAALRSGKEDAVVSERNVLMLRLREAEEKLRQSEQRYRRIVETSLAGIWIIDSQSNTEFVNQTMAEMLGYTVEEMKGAPLFAFMDEEGKANAARLVERRRRGIREIHEFRFRRKDGGDLCALLSTNPLFDQDGHYAGALAMVADITERSRAEDALQKAHDELEARVKERTAELTVANLKLQEEIAEHRQTEEALRDSEGQYRAVFEQAANAILLVDAETGALVEFNDRAHEYLGYTRQEFQKLKIADFEAVESGEEIAAHTEKIIKQGADTFETKHRTKGGEICNVLVSCKAISLGGRACFQSMWRDITRRKQAEEREERLRADLAHVGRLKTMGEMASGIAHELNQPLGAIVMRAEVAAERLRLGKRPGNEKLLEDFTWLADQGHRAGEIIRRMRRFVQHVEPERTTIKLAEVVDEVLSLVASELRHAAVRLTVEVEPSLPVVVADRIQVQQVLLNLIRNSIEAMVETEPGARELSIQAKPRGDFLEIALSDTGCGISKVKADELFGTFYSTKTTGMGMGLAISRSIIEAHGGHIWAEPRADRGATFAFTLPTAHDDLDSSKTPEYADMKET